MKRRALLLTLAGTVMLSTALTSISSAVELTRAYEGQTLNILLGAGGPWEGYRTAGEEFTKQTGIKLEYTSLGYTEQYQKLILDLTSGTGAFDAYAFAYQWKHEIASYSADLNTASAVETAPDLALDDYPNRVIDVYGMVEDKLVGLPILGDVTQLVWNKDQYTEAGLDPNKAPATWEEVFENGVKLNSAEHAGFGLPGGKASQTASVWMILFAANGGEWFDENFMPQLDSGAGLAATKFMVEKLQTIAPAGNLTWDFPEMLNGLTSGQSAQSMMWPGGFGTLLDPEQSSTAKSVAWAPTPGAALLGGWSIGVNESSAEREAALLYAAWLSSPETQKLTATMGTAPARVSVLSDPELVKDNPQYPAVLEGMSGTVAEFPPINESEQINIMIYDELNAALSGDKTAEQAVADLQAKAVEFVRTSGYLKE